MGLLKHSAIVAAFFLIAPLASRASYLPKSPDDKAIAEAKKSLCNPADEYIKALKFLRETKDFSFQEQVARKIAFQVSRGCDGAAERFSQILVLIKAVGFSERKAMDMALEFAAQRPEVQKAFLEIFTKSFLKEFFDYDSARALRLAFELSTAYRGDPSQAREDFVELSKFCRDSKKLNLPIHFCSEYAVRLAKLSQHYESGVRQPFMDFYKSLREKREFGLDIKFALEIAYGVLKSGPTAAPNFIKAFEFATTDLKLDKKKAIEFALEISSNAHLGEAPPVLQINKVAPEA